MTQKATQGKWTTYCADDYWYVYIKQETVDTLIAKVPKKEDAELIVACVNLLKDIPLSELQALKPERVRASNQMYEALKKLYTTMMELELTQAQIDLCTKAGEAIRKAEGG